MIYFNFYKKTPLHIACSKNNSEIALELLKRHDIDVNKPDNQVNTKSNWIKSKPGIYLFFNMFIFDSIAGMGE